MFANGQKYKAFILKYKALISKYMPYIFKQKPCVFFCLHIASKIHAIQLSPNPVFPLKNLFSRLFIPIPCNNPRHFIVNKYIVRSRNRHGANKTHHPCEAIHVTYLSVTHSCGCACRMHHKQKHTRNALLPLVHRKIQHIFQRTRGLQTGSACPTARQQRQFHRNASRLCREQQRHSRHGKEQFQHGYREMLKSH